MTDQDWHTDAFPELRPGPPWVMQEMIAAQPPLVEALLSSPPPDTAAAAQAITDALERDRPVVVCGCGTSEHAAHGIAALLPDRGSPSRGRASVAPSANAWFGTKLDRHGSPSPSWPCCRASIGTPRSAARRCTKPASPLFEGAQAAGELRTESNLDGVLRLMSGHRVPL